MEKGPQEGWDRIGPPNGGPNGGFQWMEPYGRLAERWADEADLI